MITAILVGASDGVGVSGRHGFTRLCPDFRKGAEVSERTLVLIKPDAVERGLIGEVLSRFERKGFVIEAMEMRVMDHGLASQHYIDHVNKGFYPELRDFMTGGPLVAFVLAGDQAVEVVRGMIGATDGRKAAAGTIRGDLGLSNQRNLVHASDSAESAAREIKLWFPELA